MLSNEDTTYAQILDPESPTGLTTYTWGYESLEPVKWNHFTNTPLKLISKSKNVDRFKLFVLTRENELFHCDNGSCDKFNQINFASSVVDIKCNGEFSMILTADGIVHYNKHANYIDSAGAGAGAIAPVNFGFDIVITKIACGKLHSVALDLAGKVYAWGNNSRGQLGLGNKKNKTEPRLVESLTDKYITQIACGDYFSVFVESNTNVYTCGDNNNGTLGLGLHDDNHAIIPNQVKFKKNISINIRTVQCGKYHVMILTTEHKLYVWGSGIMNAIGMASINIPSELIIQEKINCPIVAIYAGESRTTIVYDDAVYTCGRNWSGQLGLGHQKTISTHKAIPFFDHNQLAIIKSGHNVKSAASK